MSRLKIMCKPRNATERKLLIDAGIITAARLTPMGVLRTTIL